MYSTLYSKMRAIPEDVPTDGVIWKRTDTLGRVIRSHEAAVKGGHKAWDTRRKWWEPLEGEKAKQ